MKTICQLFAAILLIALLAGCCSCRSKQRKALRPLVGTEWQLIQIEGEKIAAEGEQYTLQLLADSQQVVGQGDCNRLTGRFEEGERRALRFSQLASTRRLCPDAATEARFFALLETVTHYDHDGSMLLLFADSSLIAVLQAKEK